MTATPDPPTTSDGIPDHVLAELDARRQQLAVAPTDSQDTPDDARLRVVIVQVGRERYGLPVSHVTGLLRLTTLAPLRGLPPFVVGITHQHGEVLAVIDIRAFFGVPRPDLTDLPLAVVIQRAGTHDRLAMLVDSVEQILIVDPDDLGEPISTHTGMVEEYQSGTTPDGCLLLDLAHILDDPRLVINRDPTRSTS